MTTITPVLSVRDATKALEFYGRAFGATEVTRTIAPNGLVVAELAIDGAGFLVADESPENFNLSRQSLGSTSVRISLIVPDPDVVAGRAVAAGAKVIFPVADQPYGYCQGKVADPFGHHWLIGRPLEGARSS